MAKVTVRKETGKLVIDFTYRGVRCREQTALPDTTVNRKRVQSVIERIKKAQLEGTFKYADYFPESALAVRFDSAVSATLSAGPVAQNGTVPFSAGPMFKDFADTWINDHSIEWRRSHTKSVLSTLRGRLLPHFGDKVVGSITKADILAFRATLAKVKGRGQKEGLSPKRINEIINLLRQILNEAADRFQFTSPAANIKKLKQKKSDVQPFSLLDVQRILATVRPDYREYFTVRFFTGMRTGEAHGLKWKYVDFDLRIIRVRETFVLGEDEDTKTEGSQRDIQMSAPVLDALKRQWAATGEKSEYVFCNQQGKPLDNKNFTDRVWYPLLRNLGLERRRPYQMRHTAATLWLASGEAPEWIARQLGHTSTEMLFRVYSRYVPNLTRQDGSAMERLLASQLSQGILLPQRSAASSAKTASTDAPVADTVTYVPAAEVVDSAPAESPPPRAAHKQPAQQPVKPTPPSSQTPITWADLAMSWQSGQAPANP